MRRVTACLVLTGLGIFASLHWLKIMHFLGWDGQTSDYYAAWSSSIPAMITAVGYTGLIASVVHRFNCHQKGCWRPGRHQIGSGVWCNKHEANARPERTVEELLELILARLPEPPR